MRVLAMLVLGCQWSLTAGACQGRLRRTHECRSTEMDTVACCDHNGRSQQGYGPGVDGAAVS